MFVSAGLHTHPCAAVSYDYRNLIHLKLWCEGFSSGRSEGRRDKRALACPHPPSQLAKHHRAICQLEGRDSCLLVLQGRACLLARQGRVYLLVKEGQVR